MALTQSEDKALVKQLIEHLLTWVWDLPGAWQMFQGTLDLYQSALERGYKREDRARRLERGDHSVLLMAAAFQCCQTLTQYVVEAEDCKTDAVHVWTHDVQRFFDWLRKWGDEERLPSYKAKAVLRVLSPAENVWAATWLFPSRFLYQVSRAPSGRFWAFVLADEPTTPLHRQLGLLPNPAPPRAAVQPYAQTPPTPQMPFRHEVPPSTDIPPSDEVALNDLVRSCLVTMATALRDGTLRVNCWPAQAFADAERIFVVYPQALALCCGHIDRPQVVLDHLVAAGLTRGIERLRVAPEGRARAIVMAGFWLRRADLGYVPDTTFRGAMEVSA